MDPTSITAAVFGLVSAGLTLTPLLTSLVNNFRGAPSLAHHLLQEVTAITAALAQLQTYQEKRRPAVDGLAFPVPLEDAVADCTECYTELQAILDKLNLSPNMGIIEKLRWTRQGSAVSLLVQRLQPHKATLTLMLVVLQ